MDAHIHQSKLPRHQRGVGTCSHNYSTHTINCRHGRRTVCTQLFTQPLYTAIIELIDISWTNYLAVFCDVCPYSGA